MADDNSRKGHRYDHERITNYVNEIHAPHDAGLDEAFAAPEHHDIPPIMIGPSEGKTLEILCRLAGAKKAVEIGTLAGYSAIWIARGLGPGESRLGGCARLVASPAPQAPPHASSRDGGHTELQGAVQLASSTPRPTQQR